MRLQMIVSNMLKHKFGQPLPNCLINKVAKLSTLVTSYLQYKIIEFLQPHPGYENDDGFQPRGSISWVLLEDGDKARDILGEFHSKVLRQCDAGNPLFAVLNELILKGVVVQTPFEPCNGDVMLGLSENLTKRQAAYEERRGLIIKGAAALGLRARWNEDGTGRLQEPGNNIVVAAGPVWELLRYLNKVEHSVLERPQLLN